MGNKLDYPNYPITNVRGCLLNPIGPLCFNPICKGLFSHSFEPDQDPNLKIWWRISATIRLLLGASEMFSQRNTNPPFKWWTLQVVNLPLPIKPGVPLYTKKPIKNRNTSPDCNIQSFAR